MEYDLHLVKTNKPIKKIKRILIKEVFGNYNTIDNRFLESGKPELGIYLFRYDKDYIVVKLDYTFMNYKSVSMALMNALGKILNTDYFIVGLVVEQSEAFIRYYKYDSFQDKMYCEEELKDRDGTVLTPQAKAKWGFDSHDTWVVMQDKMNWEILRQRLVSGTTISTPYGGEVKAKWEKNWVEKYKSIKKIKNKICDTVWFYSRPEIEELRPDAKDFTVEQKKLGKIIVDEKGNKTIIPDAIESKGKFN